MDDGFVFLPIEIDKDIFLMCLNSLHESLKFTLEIATIDPVTRTQSLNFLDIKVIKYEDGTIETEIFYKSTNSHHYLNYDSQHPRHILENIPFNLAKRIIVFTTNDEKTTCYLKKLKQHLLKCNYPEKTIDKCFHRAKLQGPAPKPKNTEIIPFVTTNYGNLNFDNIIKNTNTLIQNTKEDGLKKVFKNCKVVLGLRQPKNIKKILMPTSIPVTLENGIFNCKRPNCKICLMYLQETKTFTCANGQKWDIRSNITCSSKCCIYYLVCNMCKITTYTGRTNNLRLRTNNHIDCCRHGKGTDLFDLHVYECGVKNNNLKEPFFKLYVFMTVNQESKLVLYERMMHRKKLDTMNC